MTVDYRERTFAAGRIPGGYFKREGKARDSEILTFPSHADRTDPPGFSWKDLRMKFKFRRLFFPVMGSTIRMSRA